MEGYRGIQAETGETDGRRGVKDRSDDRSDSETEGDRKRQRVTEEDRCLNNGLGWVK